MYECIYIYIRGDRDTERQSSRRIFSKSKFVHVSPLLDLIKFSSRSVFYCLDRLLCFLLYLPLHFRFEFRRRRERESECEEQTSNRSISNDVRQAVVYLLLFLFLLGSLDLSRGRITVDQQQQQQHRHSPSSSSSVDSSVAFETTYVIPSNDNESNPNKKVRFIVQRQPPAITLPANISITTTTTKTNEMTQQQHAATATQKTLSFVDAVNNKHLDLSTGLFSSPSSFILSSTFSSSPSSSDQHRHPHTHFSSSFSPPHSSITTGDNKNFSTTSSSVNNRAPLPVGADSTATITLKEAIDANILDAHSAYVVDTLEQR